jgi:hypothetical protein
MRLQPKQAIDHVTAVLLEPSGPGDVGLLVKASLDFNQGQDLLACFGRLDQRVNDG